MKDRKFTLIELLSVCAIILLLAGMLFPTLIYVREKGKRASCAGNLKQIGLALKLYAGDYDDFFPDKDNFAGLNQLNQFGYMKTMKIYECPSTNLYKADNKVVTTTTSAYAYLEGYSEDTVHQRISLVRDRYYNHSKYGNILFGDGNVEGFSGENWKDRSNF